MEELIRQYSQVPPTQRYLLVALIIGALFAVHYYVIYDSQQSTIAALQQQYNNQQGIRNEKQEIAQNRATYEAKLGKLQQQLDEARAKLPDGADVPQLLAQLGAKARETGLAIDEFQPQEERMRDFFAEIGFRMKARGSYHEIGMFVDAVGKVDRIINVTNLEMRNPQTESSKVLVNASFDVKTYRFVSDEERKAAKKKNKKKK